MNSIGLTSVPSAGKILILRSAHSRAVSNVSYVNMPQQVRKGMVSVSNCMFSLFRFGRILRAQVVFEVKLKKILFPRA